MKHALIALVITVLLPIPVMANEKSAWKHMYETHYPNGQTQEGYLAVSTDGKNGRYSMPDDEWPEGSRFGAQAFNDQPQSTDTIFRLGPPAEQIHVNHDEETFATMTKDSMRRQTDQMKQVWGQMGVDPDSKEGQDVGHALAKAFGKVNDAKRQGIENQIKNEKAPSRKKELQQYLDDKLPQSAENTPQKVTKTGESCRHNGINGQVYTDGSGDRLQEICTAAWDAVTGGLVTKDVQESMFSFMIDLMKGVPMMARSAFESRQHIDGFPILTNTFRNGKLVSETEYVRTEKTNVLFDPPATYTQEEEGFSVNAPRKPKKVKRKGPQQPGAVGKTTKSGNKCELTEEGIVCNDNLEPETLRSTNDAETSEGKGNVDTEEAVNKIKGFLDMFK